MTTPNPELIALQTEHTKLAEEHKGVLQQLSTVRGDLATKDNLLKDYDLKLKALNEQATKSGDLEKTLKGMTDAHTKLQDRYTKNLTTRLGAFGLTEEHTKGKSIEELEAMSIALTVISGKGSNPPQLIGGTGSGNGSPSLPKNNLDYSNAIIERSIARSKGG